MRKTLVDHLLAGTMLALIVAAPTLSIRRARPGRIGRAAAAFAQRPSAASPRSRARAAAAARRLRAAIRGRAAEPRAQASGASPKCETPTNFKGTLDKQLAASDAQITDKLREIITGKQLERRVDRAPERKAIETFYAARGYAPLWIRDGQLTPQAKSVIARLKNAGADGLDAPDYPVPEFGTLHRRRGARRRRHQAHQFGSHFCPSSGGRPHRADARFGGSRLRQSHAGAGRYPQENRRRPRYRRWPRQLQPAA